MIGVKRIFGKDTRFGAGLCLLVSMAEANAEIILSGSAELGVNSGDFDEFRQDNQTQLHTSLDVSFRLVGQTGHGLLFGATVDLEDVSPEAFQSPTHGGTAVFVSGDFGTLALGDVDGAFDRVMSEAIIASSIADDHEHLGYNNNRGLDNEYGSRTNIARYTYRYSGIEFALSGQVEGGRFNEAQPILGAGLSFGLDLGSADLGLGIGYQAVSDTGFSSPVADRIDLQLVGFSADASFNNGFRAILNYTKGSGSTANGPLPDISHFGVALGYNNDKTTISANYGAFENWILNDLRGSEGFGIAINYDFGGGAQLQFGYGYNDDETMASPSVYETWSFGLALQF